MGLPGPAPKPREQQRHRVKPAHEWTIVANVAYDGPDLPETRPDGRRWPEWTLRWWKAVSTMPHAALWTDADWEFAYATAAIAAAMHESAPDKVTTAATELRQREAILGMTTESRMKLRIRYVAPAADPPEQVTRLDDYRNL